MHPPVLLAWCLVSLGYKPGARSSLSRTVCFILNLCNFLFGVVEGAREMVSIENQKKPLKIVAGADDFGCALKDSLVQYLKEKGVQVEDLGTNKYYSAGEEVGRRVSLAQKENEAVETRGLVACGTGVGVSIFANKFPGVYAATCDSVQEAQNSRSINNSNVIAVGGMHTTPEEGRKIIDAWLETPFKAPCPASEGKPWPQEIQSFLDTSIDEMAKVGEQKQEIAETCALCSIQKLRTYEPVDIMPGASMCIVRENPTAATVKFKAGSIEPAHHHTFGHDLVVLSGNKVVWNLTKNQSFELGPGDYLYTPAPDVHRVYYYTDTEFFIRWDGHWDIFLDEDLATAASVIKANPETSK